jgi:hypothetical protein
MSITNINLYVLNLVDQPCILLKWNLHFGVWILYIGYEVISPQKFEGDKVHPHFQNT